MATHALSAYERTVLRAQMEPMTVTLLGDDLAEVTNLSYGRDSDTRYEHTYMVDIDPDATPSGEPVACSCPGYALGRAYCKHQIKVKRVLLGFDDEGETHDSDTDADADADPEAVADGGRGTCQNGQAGCCGPDGDDLPCFDCFVESGGEH